MKIGQLPVGFLEDEYLALNKDVAKAVAAGGISSGAEHFLRYGMFEDRPWRSKVRPPPLAYPFPSGHWPTRRDKILANLDLETLEGVEIGALASPLVTRDEGRILFIDHADTEAIKSKYAADPSVNQGTIVEVDAVWGSQTLQECIGGGKKVDYVLASHVIEHVPNLIGWLLEIRSILRPNGSLRLAIPDRRYTFDYLRSESRIPDVLEAYLLKVRSPLPRFIMEHTTFARRVDCGAAWDGPIDSTLLEPMGTVRSGLELAHDAIANGVYHDTHCWIFTPLSFAELCRDIAELDLMNFSCQLFFETPRNKIEFYVHLSPSDDKEAIIESWEKMRVALLRSCSYQKSAKDLLDLNALLRVECSWSELFIRQRGESRVT